MGILNPTHKTRKSLQKKSTKNNLQGVVLFFGFRFIVSFALAVLKLFAGGDVGNIWVRKKNSYC